MPFNQKPIEIVISQRRKGAETAAFESFNPRDAFWQPLKGRLRLQELSTDALEGHTLRELNISMMEALTNHWLPPEVQHDKKSSNDKESGSNPQRESRSLFDRLRLGSKKPETPYTSNLEKAAIASKIVVKTEIGYYSSLGLLMWLEPIKEVVRLFEGNFDYFQIFLGAYIPIAFAQAVGDEAFADGMQYQVEVPPSLRNQFSEVHTGGLGTQGAAPGASTQIGKANWAWIISNTSLVVPVLLAAAILYVAFTKLNEWAGSERKAFERVIEFQAQAISEDRERFKLLFDELQRKREPPPQPVPQPQRRAPKKSKKKKH
jgi:hypothetical protein